MTEKLTARQSTRLREHLQKVELNVFGAGLGIPFFLLIVSFIPAGFLPGRKAARVADQSASLVSMLGFLPLLGIIIIFAGLLLWYLMRSYKYPELKKDVIERDKVTLHTRVYRVDTVRADDGVKHDVIFGPGYENINRVTFTNYPGFPVLYKGQNIHIEFTRHAHYPLSITTPSAPADNKDISSPIPPYPPGGMLPIIEP